MMGHVTDQQSRVDPVHKAVQEYADLQPAWSLGHRCCGRQDTSDGEDALRKHDRLEIALGKQEQGFQMITRPASLPVGDQFPVSFFCEKRPHKSTNKD